MSKKPRHNNPICAATDAVLSIGSAEQQCYKRHVSVTSWRFHNRTWQPQCHDRLPETSGTLWIHRVALTNQRCSLATGCGINVIIVTSLCTLNSNNQHFTLTQQQTSCAGKTKYLHQMPPLLLFEAEGPTNEANCACWRPTSLCCRQQASWQGNHTADHPIYDGADINCYVQI